ncbi:MAG: oligosaccharide flippase family protein [Nitrospira sp.]|nr:oligosaccharide flippase family protein [Nitrospira sp.]
MLWATLGTITSKSASFGAQLVLGWTLEKEDFALYAIAISWSTIAFALRNGGTEKLLVQSGRRYEEYAVPCFKIGLAFNCLILLTLLLAAPALANYYQSSSLQTLICIIGLSIPLNTVAMIFQARLSSELRFGELARLTIWSAILRHASMVLFALMGFGAISFVLPLLVITIFEAMGGWFLVGSWPPNRQLTWPLIRNILLDTRWIMLTTFAGMLVLNGDYWAISLLQSKETLGVYYFGFQLTFSIAVLFGGGVEAVMMPTFSRLRADTQRQTAAFHRAVRLVVFGTTLVSFALVLSAPALLHFLWGGKWDSATIVVQLLGLSLPVKMVLSLCRSLMEGRGEWKFISYLLLVDGAGTVLAAFTGGLFGGVAMIAAMIAAYNVIFGFLFYSLISLRTTSNVRKAFLSLGIPFILGILALGSTSLLILVHPFNNYSLPDTGVVIVIFVALYLILTRIFEKDNLSDAVSLVRQIHRPAIAR